MTRQTTNQGQQRARVTRRRRFRGPGEVKHGERSQSGVRVRSAEGWKAWVARRKAAIARAVEHDELVAGWRKREAEKRAAKEAKRNG